MHAKAQSPQTIDDQLRDVFAHFPKVKLVLVFGSVASGKQRPDSDLDIAAGTGHPLTADERMKIISHFDLQDIVSLNLSRAVQLSVDISAHLIARINRQWQARVNSGVVA